MKSVLISIKPKWCELIASGKKTVEIRRTKPKIDTPFKCYIYCTKPKGKNDLGLSLDRGISGNLKSIGLLFKQNYETALNMGMDILSGKVIGEFVCDNVKMSLVGYDKNGCPSYWDIVDGSCLTANELVCYGEWKTLYGWHISNLVIYEKPKELSEFYTVDNEAVQNCKNRVQTYHQFTDTGYIKNGFACHCNDDWCTKCKTKPLTRPPQSWCYVETQ